MWIKDGNSEGQIKGNTNGQFCKSQLQWEILFTYQIDDDLNVGKPHINEGIEKKSLYFTAGGNRQI